MGTEEGRTRASAGEGVASAAATGDGLEPLLAHAIRETMEGRRPDLLALCEGDADEARRLQRALACGLSLVPRKEDQPLPRRLGPYRVEGELGHGGMGSVLLGRHEVLGRRVAVKFLPRPFAFIDDYRRRFRREAQVVASLDHPSIVPIHEVGEQDGIPYAAFEYVEGGSLEDMLRELRGRELSVARTEGTERLPGGGSYERRCAAMLASVADALHVAHQAGVVHRDVKPANILLDGDGGALLSDFGLALPPDAGTLTHSGAVVGTRHYLAPELTTADGRATPSADVYSLGVTLYELLTLRAPFRDDEEEGLFRRIREQRPRPPRQLNRHVPRDLEAVCLKALEKRPGRRYETAAEMADDLRAVVRSRPVDARRAPVPRRAWATACYHRRAIGGWAAVGLLIVTVPLVFLELWGRAEAERERRWNENWSRAQAILVSDLRYQAPWFERQRLEALEALRRCAALDGRPRVYFAMAEVIDRLVRAMPHGDPRRLQLRMDQHDAILRAWALGGFSRRLGRIISRRAWDAFADFRRYEWLSWSSLDCYELAVELFLDGQDKAVYEVLQARSIAEDDMIISELLEAVILERDSLRSEPTLGLDRELGVGLAVERYDSFIEEYGEHPLVALRRADLLCDAWLRGVGTTEGETSATFERIAEQMVGFLGDEVFSTDARVALRFRSTRIKALWVLFLSSDNDHTVVDRLLRTLDELDDHQILTDLDLQTYSAIVRCLIVAGEYRRADELLAEVPLRHGGTSIDGQVVTFDGRVTRITRETVSEMPDQDVLGLPAFAYDRALGLLWSARNFRRFEKLVKSRSLADALAMHAEQERRPSAAEMMEHTRDMVLTERLLLSDVPGFRKWAEWRTPRWPDHEKERVDYLVRTVEHGSAQIRRGETPTPLDEPTPFERRRQAEAAKAATDGAVEAPKPTEDR